MHCFILGIIMHKAMVRFFILGFFTLVPTWGLTAPQETKEPQKPLGINSQEKTPAEDQDKAPNSESEKPLVTSIIAAWSDSPESLTDVAQRVKSLGGYGSISKYIDGRSKWLVLFILQTDSDPIDVNTLAGKEKDFVHFIILPIEKILIRTAMTIKFENGLNAFTRSPVTFWIGDSAPVTFPSVSIQKDQVVDVNTFVPDFQSCKSITPNCLRTLISEGYLVQNTVIEGHKEYPLSYLKEEFHHSYDLHQKNPDVGRFRINSLYSSLRNVIADITLNHRLWVFLKPGSEMTSIGSFSDLTGSKIMDFNTPGYPVLKTPLTLSKEHISNETMNDGKDMKTLMGSFYDISYKAEFRKKH